MRLQELTLKSVNQRMMESGVCNPDLLPYEQALLVTSFWAMHFNNKYQSKLRWGSILTYDKFVVGYHNVMYQPHLSGYLIQDHWFTTVWINGMEIIIDYNLSRRFDQHHSSIPDGAFQQKDHPRYQYRPIDTFTLSQKEMNPVYLKLRVDEV